MKRPTKYAINKKLSLGFHLFNKHDFLDAAGVFANVLADQKDNVEAKIGILLSDMALDFPEIAMAINNYYTIQKAKGIGRVKIQQEVLKRIKEVDLETDFLINLKNTFEDMEVNQINGVLYKDFKDIATKKKNFKQAFEDMMFSSKIIFTNQDEFYDFLDKLVENDYVDISLEYIDQIKQKVIFDDKLDLILRKIYKK